MLFLRACTPKRKKRKGTEKWLPKKSRRQILTRTSTFFLLPSLILASISFSSFFRGGNSSFPQASLSLSPFPIRLLAAPSSSEGGGGGGGEGSIGDLFRVGKEEEEEWKAALAALAGPYICVYVCGGEEEGSSQLFGHYSSYSPRVAANRLSTEREEEEERCNNNRQFFIQQNK